MTEVAYLFGEEVMKATKEKERERKETFRILMSGLRYAVSNEKMREM